MILILKSTWNQNGEKCLTFDCFQLIFNTTPITGYIEIIFHSINSQVTELSLLIEEWEPERHKWHFTNFTGEPKQFTVVWSDFVYWFQLFIIKMCTLVDNSTFPSRKCSLRAFIWSVNLHFTKNITYTCLVLTPRYVLSEYSIWR